MGALAVELLDEGVEAGLLLEAVHAGRPGRLLLEGEVHALETAVLLRVARLDALDGDAQSEPPDRQLGEIEQAVRAGERQAVVAADGVGQAAFEEEPLESCDDRLLAGRFEGLAQQDSARRGR